MNKIMGIGAIFGIATIAILFAPSAIAGSHPAYLDIDEITTSTSDFTTLDIAIKTNAKIATNSATPFGYGIFTNSTNPTNNVLALATHGVGLLDHSDQNGDGFDPVFHAHVLDLKAPSVDCNGFGTTFDAEVDWDSTVLTGNNPSPEFPVKLKGKTIEVTASIASDLINDAGVEGVVAFTITANATAISPVTGLPALCLDVVP